MIYNNLRIHLIDKILENAYLKIENKKIVEIGTDYSGGVDCHNADVIPGFIDIHVHGSNGADFMDGTEEALDVITSNLVTEGVTSVLATTMTSSSKKLVNVLENIANYNYKKGHCKIVGIHLEGPFINVSKKGAQSRTHIQDLEVATMEQYLAASQNMIKICTYAPELDPGYNFTKFLIKKGITPSIGHSDASCNTCNKVMDMSSSLHLTHLYNAMKPFSHRDLGVVNFALEKKPMVELIVDGIHVDRDVVKFTYQHFGKENIMLVTDAIEAKNLEPGTYTLGGQKVIVKDGECRLESGVLAGSILRYDTAFQNMMDFCEINILDAMVMTSYNQAKSLNLELIGEIKVGNYADIVFLDEEKKIIRTIVEGEIAYESV